MYSTGFVSSAFSSITFIYAFSAAEIDLESSTSITVNRPLGKSAIEQLPLPTFKK
jgi:hypothetical protein